MAGVVYTMIVTIPTPFDKAAQKLMIEQSEERFETQLDEVCKQLKAREDLKIISLSGPSCAGKTTTARKIISELQSSGKLVKTISIDDFYKNREDYEKDCKKKGIKSDLESISAIDMDYFCKCFSQVFSGQTALLPSFDFSKGRRSGLMPFTMRENHVIMFEGIQAIYPEIRALFGQIPSAYVFIDAKDSFESGISYFTGREIRLARRLVRDFHKRGASAEHTYRLWEQVVENEDRSIYPHLELVDYHIDSTMSYEPMMLKKELTTILGSIKENSKYYAGAQSFLGRFAAFPEMDHGLLPENSVYHEFL